jgi:nucleoid-associated protein YgaU
VRPGDSLWSVTARYLGPGASASDIAEAWPDWFEANRSVIGDNPDVIRPGQLLVAPHR